MFKLKVRLVKVHSRSHSHLAHRFRRLYCAKIVNMSIKTKNGSAKSEGGKIQQDESWLAYILINYRWVFVCFFLLPISLVYDIYHLARSWIIFQLNSAPKKHDERVQYVQQQVMFLVNLCL